MVKSQLHQQVKKDCFGTKEWSENSGICNGCELKVACGKASKKNNEFLD